MHKLMLLELMNFYIQVSLLYGAGFVGGTLIWAACTDLDMSSDLLRLFLVTAAYI